MNILTNTLTDDQGNKWQLIEFFSYEEQLYCYQAAPIMYALQPVPLKEDETWKENN